MKQGCVSEEAYNSRRNTCEGCPKNQIRQRDGAHFCGGCGCGARPMATLYVERIPQDEDHSIRLWMPLSNCPDGLHKDEPGTGSCARVGGRMKQLKDLTMTALLEITGIQGMDKDLEYINSTVKIVETVVETDEEMEELVQCFNMDLSKATEQLTKEQNEDEKTKEHSHSGTLEHPNSGDPADVKSHE